MTTLILYTTAGCHLCVLGEDIIKSLPKHYDITLVAVEIGDNDELVDRYGVSIPVIKFSDNSELNWPFEAQDIPISGS